MNANFRVCSAAIAPLLFGITVATPLRSAAVNFVPPAESEAPAGATTGNAATRGTFVPPAASEVPEAATAGNAATRQAFLPPADTQTPSAASAQSAATRGERCSADNPERLQALLPKQHNFGMTLQERPAFFVHLPGTEAPQAFFSLKTTAPDGAERTLYSTVIPLNKDRAGILRWQLPADAPALEVGRDYHWYFVLQCGSRLEIDDPYVDGWVRRISPPDTLSVPPSADSLEVATAYGRAGLWYDLLVVMADRHSDPAVSRGAIGQWRALLSSETVGLGSLAEAPLLARP